MAKLDKKIGLRVDETTLKILDGASQIYNTGMSELIRIAVARQFSMQVAEHKLKKTID